MPRILGVALLAALLFSPALPAAADGILDGAGRKFEFKPLSFAGSSLRDAIPSACGLMPWEVVVGGGAYKIKPPKELAGRKGDFDEREFGIGLPIPGLYYRLRESQTTVEGGTRIWRVDSTDHTVGYRFVNHDAGGPQWAVEFGRRTVDPLPIRIKGVPAPEVSFLKDGTNDHFKLIRTTAHGDRFFRHLMVGGSVAKFGDIERTSSFGGLGIDRMIGKRIDWQNSALLIRSETRPTNAHLSSRATLRILHGLSVSLDAGMFTDGFTYAPLRFADHFVPALTFGADRIPETLRKFESKAFGYWGVGLHYGVKF